MNEKALKVLEYPKIIQKLTDYAASQPGKQLCRDLTPSSDPGTIRRMQTETSDAVSRLLRKGNISFSGLTDIRGSLRRLEIGKLRRQPGVFGKQMVVFLHQLLLFSFELLDCLLVRSGGFFNIIDNVCAGKAVERRAESGKVGHKSASKA